MIEYRVTLRGTADYQSAIQDCTPGEPLTVYGDKSDPKYWLVRDEAGRDLGELPRRGRLIDAVLEGASIIRCEVDTVIDPTESKPRYGLKVMVRLADGGEAVAYSAGLAALMRTTVPRDETPALRAYKVGIVGERSHQPAIRACREGGTVEIVHEVGNPHDRKALAVYGPAGRIGYIGRDHWLRRAIHDEGQGCTATIVTIAAGGAGDLGVVLDVTLGEGPIGRRDHAVAAIATPYVPAAPILAPRSIERERVQSGSPLRQLSAAWIAAIGIVVLIVAMSLRSAL